MLGLARDCRQIAAAVIVVGGCAKEVMLAEPGKKTGRQNIRTPGNLLPAGLMFDPVFNKVTRPASRGVATDGAQITQPIEAMQFGQPGLAHPYWAPGVFAAANSLAQKGQFSGRHGGPAFSVAGP